VTEPARPLPVVDECWSRIGVRGDRSCPELRTVEHCHGCRTFARAAEVLLDRPIDAAYLEERAKFVAEPMTRGREVLLSAVVFDVGPETYALEGKSIVEVTEARSLHRIPRRTNGVFRGLVNVHGQLELCFSLAGLLGVEEAAAPPAGTPRRVVVVELEGRRAVLLVDRVRGAERFEKGALRDVPATSARRSLPLVRAVLVEGDVRIGLLDAEALRTALEESLR
jgi:chemotaxis-related protein WspD